MKMAIIEALQKSHSYSKYRQIVTDLLAHGKSSGNIQSTELTHYSALNETRMNRLDKTIGISEENIQKLLSLSKKYIWLVLSEGWCGDAAQLLPIFNKMAAISKQIDLKIIFRDEQDKLMGQFLTNGARSIPKVIIIDTETSEVLGSWGPRPAGASQLIKSYRQQYGAIDETAKTELQLWYTHDKGLSTQNELTTLMLHLDQLSPQKK
jgi:thioredoxin-like negative regulator of GroEL